MFFCRVNSEAYLDSRFDKIFQQYSLVVLVLAQWREGSELANIVDLAAGVLLVLRVESRSQLVKLLNLLRFDILDLQNSRIEVPKIRSFGIKIRCFTNVVLRFSNRFLAKVNVFFDLFQRA